MAVVDKFIDLVTGNKASDIQRKAQREAGRIMEKGYDTATGYQKPIYDTALGQYQNLAKRYDAGEFDMPESRPFQGGSFQADKFSWDPRQVFDDPEYQAQMRAGTDALSNSAASKGMLFSGQTGVDLARKGQDIFAGRSDALYNRARGAFQNDRDFGRRSFENDRDFGFDASNRAWDQNFARTGRNFSQGMSLASPLEGSADTLGRYSVGKASDLADSELGVGQTRANAWRSGGKALGGAFNDALGLGVDAYAAAPRKKVLGAGQTDLAAYRDYRNIG
jgi:hypothetical protein